MTTIWKFPIDLSQGPRVAIDMPMDAKILTLQVQNGVPCLWALVDPSAPIETKPFVVVGTGHEKPIHATAYVGTWQDGPFVWHLFAELQRATSEETA